MRKLKLLALFIALWCCCLLKALAACSDPNTCIKMCSYEETVEVKTYIDTISGPTPSTTTETKLVEINYYIDKDEYEIVYVGGNFWLGTDKVFKGSLEKLANDKNLDGADLQEGVCPTDLSVDISGSAFNSSAVCIAYDDATCKFSQDKNPAGWNRYTSYTSTDFKTVTTKLSTKKTYDFPEQITKKINEAFEKYKKENMVIDETKSFEENPFCKKIYPENTLTKEEIFSYIEKELNNVPEFKGKTLPKWVSTSNPYQSIINYFTTGEGIEMLKKCQTIATNDKNLSDEEKEDIINGLDENANIFIEDLYEEFENRFNYNFTADFTGLESCLGFLGSKTNHMAPAYYLDMILNIMRYAAIVLTIILSSIDFLKAVIAQDKDMLKKATSNSIKRLILAVLLFFLPTLIDFILSLLGGYNTCVREW